MARNEGAAVVIGASMAGLVAARALSDYFREVMVVERDDLGASFEPRKGVPQGRHTHGLLARGLELLEGFFPGFADDAKSMGAVEFDICNDFVWYNYNVTMRRGPSRLLGVSLSRPRMEGLVRKRVAALDNVTILDNSDVVELVFDRARGRVAGVSLRGRASGSQAKTFAADLVVDATGRGSRCQDWLDAMGFERAPEESVKVDLSYTTAIFSRRPGRAAIKGAVAAACPPDWRIVGMLAQEDNSWIVTLGGHFGDKAPTDREGFLAFARSLQSQVAYDIIKDEEVISEPTQIHFPAHRRRRFERLTRFPEGYLIVGDAMCSFNPVYGQGMTVAATEAKLLSGCLQEGLGGIAGRFFKRARLACDIPWEIAVGSDLLNPKVEGLRPPKVRFLHWYLGKLFTASQRDCELSRQFLEVANLRAAPTALLAPGVAWRVLLGGIETREATLRSSAAGAATR
jgi:2-polyprenyl-6-methoxyphenol hydroxylase-like FAD-dependent oxidoreductase